MDGVGVGFGINQSGVGKASLGDGLFVMKWGLKVVESAGRRDSLHVGTRGGGVYETNTEGRKRFVELPRRCRDV